MNKEEEDDDLDSRYFLQLVTPDVNDGKGMMIHLVMFFPKRVNLLLIGEYQFDDSAILDDFKFSSQLSKKEEETQSLKDLIEIIGKFAVKNVE